MNVSKFLKKKVIHFYNDLTQIDFLIKKIFFKYLILPNKIQPDPANPSPSNNNWRVIKNEFFRLSHRFEAFKNPPVALFWVEANAVNL